MRYAAILIFCSSVAAANTRPLMQQVVEEGDRLPPPPLEIVDGPAAVQLPAIPAALPRAVARTPPAIPPPQPTTIVSQTSHDVSISMFNACHDAIDEHRLDAAIAACEASTNAWPANHLAWYALANAHAGQGRWRDAHRAAARAVFLRPDVAMYELLDGVARYRTGELAGARLSLERALAIEPRLWRAHHMLGELERDQGQLRRAAEQLSAAIRSNPGERASYIALAQLYRKARLPAVAASVAAAGALQVDDADSVGLWFELALAADAQHDGEGALQALERGLAIDPDDGNLRITRARILADHGGLAEARADLEAVIRKNGPAAGRARQLLAALRSRPADATPQKCQAARCYDYNSSSASWMGSFWVPPVR